MTENSEINLMQIQRIQIGLQILDGAIMARQLVLHNKKATKETLAHFKELEEQAIQLQKDATKHLNEIGEKIMDYLDGCDAIPPSCIEVLNALYNRLDADEEGAPF